MSDPGDRLPRDAAETRAFINSLIHLWDRDRDKPFEMKTEHSRGSGPMIWSFANHNVELSRTVVELSKADRMLIAAPLVRLAIDNAMTSAWLLTSPEATKSLLHEGLRQKRAAVEQIVGLGAKGFDQASLAKATADLDEFDGFGSAQGKNMEQRFKALVGGADIYVTYRMASALSHAGMTLADEYLREVPVTDEAPLGVALDPDAKLSNGDAWLGTQAAMLLHSMNICDQITGKRRHKNQLAKAAKALGVTTEIRLVAG